MNFQLNPQAMPAQADPLSALRDIHLPEPVSFWPLAPGWWVLAGLVVLSAVGAYVLVRRRRRGLRRAALDELELLLARFRETRDTSTLASGLSMLVRRFALLRFPRADVAALHGEEWTEFLEHNTRRPAAIAVLAGDLELALYAPPGSFDVEAGDRWAAAVREWIGGQA